MMKSGAQAAYFAILMLVTSPALAGAGGAKPSKDAGYAPAQDQLPASSNSEAGLPSPAPDEAQPAAETKDPAPQAEQDQPPNADEPPGAAETKDPAPQAEQDQPPKADEPPGAVDVPSAEAMAVIDWVIAVHDNNDLPFMVIDKVAAEVFLFDPSGQRIAAAPALVGMATGDEETPGTGDRELSSIKPADRKTPAGRFVAKFGYAAGGRDVLWVDYPSAISLHAVINVKNQHRLERLKSPTPDDNRITYGCINVPASFYAKFVKPMFKATTGIVYILPESKSLNEVFLAMPEQPGAREASSQAQ